MSMERQAHVRDLLCTRLFRRETIAKVGSECVEKVVARLRHSDYAHSFLSEMFKEEFNVLNLGKIAPEKMFSKYVDDDVQILATLKVDKCIVRVEEQVEEEDAVVEVIVIDDDEDEGLDVVTTPPKCNNGMSKDKSPCTTTPDVNSPKPCRKRAKRTYPKRSSNKKLHFDCCIGCSRY
ncbi:hypothetical protein RND81_11G177700 [Saponaria officinalis]|uniref:Uncharacterized protein n=1 Tax=Saponaria officinalis TaxID=3572 RepID=A0AAW1HPJ0_SAPOF